VGERKKDSRERGNIFFFIRKGLSTGNGDEGRHKEKKLPYVLEEREVTRR